MFWPELEKTTFMFQFIDTTPGSILHKPRGPLSVLLLHQVPFKRSLNTTLPNSNTDTRVQQKCIPYCTHHLHRRHQVVVATLSLLYFYASRACLLVLGDYGN